jgi:hypothetical protein
LYCQLLHYWLLIITIFFWPLYCQLFDFWLLIITIFFSKDQYILQ